MAVVTVSQRGCVVIPAALRAKYHWNAGDRIKVVDYGSVVSLVPVLHDPEEEGMGALGMRGRSLLRGLKRTRNEARRRDKRRRVRGRGSLAAGPAKVRDEHSAPEPIMLAALRGRPPK